MSLFDVEANVAEVNTPPGDLLSGDRDEAAAGGDVLRQVLRPAVESDGEVTVVVELLVDRCTERTDEDRRVEVRTQRDLEQLVGPDHLGLSAAVLAGGLDSKELARLLYRVGGSRGTIDQRDQRKDILVRTVADVSQCHLVARLLVQERLRHVRPGVGRIEHQLTEPVAQLDRERSVRDVDGFGRVGVALRQMPPRTSGRRRLRSPNRPPIPPRPCFALDQP